MTKNVRLERYSTREIQRELEKRGAYINGTDVVDLRTYTIGEIKSELDRRKYARPSRKKAPFIREPLTQEQPSQTEPQKSAPTAPTVPLIQERQPPYTPAALQISPSPLERELYNVRRRKPTTPSVQAPVRQF